jgi:poly(hydroxyalkanoate) depolymerase family esterase
MSMNSSHPMYAGMMEATRLTRAGRLSEAAALIQRNLQAGARHAPMPTSAADDDVIDVAFADVSSSRPEGSKARWRPADWIRPTRVVDREPIDVETETVQRPGSVRAPGQFIAGSFGNHAGTRAYKLYVPTAHAGRALPLVVMLHGCKQNPDDFAAGTRMNALAESQPCLVLYPAQARQANQAGCWHWFRREDQMRDHGEPSIIAGMTRQVMQRYGIDPRQVCVAGLSAGGAMAAVLGVTYPELYAAVGIHSGLACGSAKDLPSALAAMHGIAPAGQAVTSMPPVPTIVFHGDRDRTVHPRNGEQVVQGSVAAGQTGGKVQVERGRVAGGHGYTRSIHHDAGGRAVLESWVVHGGGHAWFGGSAEGSYVDPKGPAASDAMLRFFLARA